MRQLFFGAYTFAAVIASLLFVAANDWGWGISMLACAGVGAVALTKGERY